MSIRDRFKRAAMRGQRDGRPIVGGERRPMEPDDPDAVTIAGAMRHSKLADRQFYGPGAAAANARRADRMRPPESDPAVIARPPAATSPVRPTFETEPSRRDQKRRDRLMRKMDDIRKRLEALSK